jgi:hypothetical protein
VTRAARVGLAAATIAWSAGCAPGGPSASSPAPAPTPAPAAKDSARPSVGRTTAAARDSGGLVPAGYGSLRQEDIALRLQRLNVQIRLVPLDESVIRLLAPDSYRNLRGLRESRRPEIVAIERRTGAREPSLWLASFFSSEPGEARYSPTEVTIANVGRDFRPLDVLAVTAGFGDERLRQRETQTGIIVFDGQLDVNQPLTVSYETAQNADWAAVLQVIERERSLVRARAQKE